LGRVLGLVMSRRRYLRGVIPAVVITSLFLGASVASAQVAQGVVFTETTATPLAGVWVTLLDSAFAEIDSVETNALGVFRLKLPAPSTYSFAVTVPGHSTAVAGPMAVGPGGVQGLMLGLRALGEGDRGDTEIVSTAEARTSGVFGRVVEYSTGEPLGGVDITLEPGGRRVITDVNGMFSLTELPPGTYVLATHHIVYRDLERELFVAAEAAYQLSVRLDPDVLPVEGLVVTARARSWLKTMEGVRFRMSQALGGIYLLPEDLEARGNPPVSRAIRGLAGVRVRERPGAATAIFRRCSRPPSFWIDGVRVSGEDVNINMVSGMDIEMIEIYKSPASVPGEFAGSDSICGALIIWTKRGG
jgi:CarboxypepD_reg-like domain/TonB-dependent Receptor Plug Domain